MAGQDAAVGEVQGVHQCALPGNADARGFDHRYFYRAQELPLGIGKGRWAIGADHQIGGEGEQQLSAVQGDLTIALDGH